MSVMVLDAGNSIIKAKIARRQDGEVSFPHAMQKLTEAEYRGITSRAGIQNRSEDYLRINGVAYVIGESAELHGFVSRRSGAARYTRDYYGVLAAAALSRLYDRGREIAAFCSHPPGDVAFRDDLMEAVVGYWQLEHLGREKNFRVSYANTFDEPVGGLMNVLLTEDGRHYRRTGLNGGRTLVIDIGGFTTDWLSVNPGGVVDYSLARSVPLGVNQVLATFEESFRAGHTQLVKNTLVLPAERVRKAIQTGLFEGGGKKHDCRIEVEEATSLLLNRIADSYQNLAGGGLGWDAIILTGGGSGLLHDRLLPILGHEKVLLADEMSAIHLANVRGGQKLWRLYEALEII